MDIIITKNNVGEVRKSELSMNLGMESSFLSRMEMGIMEAEDQQKMEEDMPEGVFLLRRIRWG
ncbi:MAG TPA: hypothetical protein VLN47_07415, partial [Clostridiaceae bacterium]|nr:hypothetical protein [Clostridiaceae bacterium]